MGEPRTAPAGVRHHLPDETLRERWGSDLEDLRHEFQAADRWIRRLAEERPLVALAAAVAVGYFAGRVLSRV